MVRQNLTPRTLRARALRQSSPIAERRIWGILRGRQLGGFKFRRQVPIDRYFVDFACLDARLVVELDGSQHLGQTDYDGARTWVLESAGWQVLRIWDNEVMENLDGVAEAILAALRSARP